MALPGASKEKIDLRVTEDSLYVDAKANPREGKYLRREMGTMGRKREIKLPIEVKPEQVKASFKDGILEVHLPKLVVSKRAEGAGGLDAKSPLYLHFLFEERSPWPLSRCYTFSHRSLAQRWHDWFRSA